MKFKLISKEVEGLPWDRDIRLNYFRALIITDAGEELDPQTIWSHSEHEAIEESSRWYAQKLREEAEVERDYEGYPKAAAGKSGRSNYRGYYVLSTDKQWVGILEEAHAGQVAPLGRPNTWF